MVTDVYSGVTKLDMLFLRSIRNWITLSCLLFSAPAPAPASLPVSSSVRDVATSQVLAAAHALSAKWDTIPRPVGYINDFEHLFTPGQIDTLDNLLHDFEQRTTIEIAVLTADSTLTMYANFDFFTLKTMSAWRIGKKESDNGMLIGISRSFRKIRIQNGSGITKGLPNADTKKIIDESFIPFFKKGQYYEGLLNGLKTIMQRLE
jgi:uncharacterized protein